MKKAEATAQGECNQLKQRPLAEGEGNNSRDGMGERNSLWHSNGELQMRSIAQRRQQLKQGKMAKVIAHGQGNSPGPKQQPRAKAIRVYVKATIGYSPN